MRAPSPAAQRAERPAVRAAAAGLAYGGAVFLAGAVLGTVRTLLLTGTAGLSPVAAVLLEIPVILAASWWICGAVLDRVPVRRRTPIRAVTGAVALATLLLLETVLALALGGGAGDVLLGIATPAGALGFLAQIAFAAFPVVRRR